MAKHEEHRFPKRYTIAEKIKTVISVDQLKRKLYDDLFDDYDTLVEEQLKIKKSKIM